jgi:HrpA-like RNA helicase
VFVTSATLDAKRFAAYFAFDGKEAPVIEVSGRMFPVDIRYRPVREEKGEADAADLGTGATFATPLPTRAMSLRVPLRAISSSFFPVSAKSAKPPTLCAADH